MGNETVEARLNRLESVLQEVLRYQIRYDCFREESPEWFAEKDRLSAASELMKRGYRTPNPEPPEEGRETSETMEDKT